MVRGRYGTREILRPIVFIRPVTMTVFLSPTGQNTNAPPCSRRSLKTHPIQPPGGLRRLCRWSLAPFNLRLLPVVTHRPPTPHRPTKSRLSLSLAGPVLPPTNQPSAD